MANLYINGVQVLVKRFNNLTEVIGFLNDDAQLKASEFYLEKNGKKITQYDCNVGQEDSLNCILRVGGGKGGFGSMLRAIGAQIEKTTNREACRDLSGRRLRDINEEKRIKSYLKKQNEQTKQAEHKTKNKIEKLLSVPKTEYKDEQYESARSNIAEKVSNAIDAGLTNSLNDVLEKKGKRVHPSEPAAVKAKRKKTKTTLWIDGDTDSTDLSDSDEEVQKNKKSDLSEEGDKGNDKIKDKETDKVENTKTINE